MKANPSPGRSPTNDRVSGIPRIGLGAPQIIALVTVIAGAWNIWADISRLAIFRRVRVRVRVRGAAGVTASARPLLAKRWTIAERRLWQFAARRARLSRTIGASIKQT